MADDELIAARELYEATVGKKPYHGWDVETLTAKIAAGAGPLDHDNDGKAGGAKKLPDTLDVYLDYDTWIGDVRVVADKDKAQALPYERAKALLTEGKARRADPLPGE